MKPKSKRVDSFDKLIARQRLTITTSAVLLAFFVSILFLMLNTLLSFISLESNAKSLLESSLVNAVSEGIKDEERGDDLYYFYIGEEDKTIRYFHEEDREHIQPMISEILKRRPFDFFAYNNHLILSRTGLQLRVELPVDDSLLDDPEFDSMIFYALIDENDEILQVQNQLLTYSLYVVMIILFLAPLFYGLSNMIVRPSIDSMKEQNAFISDASHNLKTPLAVIKADAELLSQTQEDNVYLNNIRSQVDAMNEMIQSMLEYNRLQTQASIVEIVDVSDLLDNLLLDYEVRAFESGIDLQYLIEKELILEQADSSKLKVMFRLLLDNAMKYTTGEKKVRLQLKKEKKNIVFNIFNTGCKVQKEEDSLIFNRFFRAKENDPTIEGSGLGLGIVKAICDKFGYQIITRFRYDVAFEIEIHLPM